MKFKRCISAICSSALVLGLSFLLYPQSDRFSGASVPPTGSVVPTATPAITDPVDITDPRHSATETPNATATPTVAPEVAFLPLLNGDLKEPLPDISDLVTAYVTAYYNNDAETIATLVTDASLFDASVMENDCKNVKKLENLELYSKPGIDGVFSIVYATYSLYYSDLQISVPQLSEYYVKRMPDGSFLIQTAPLSAKTTEVFTQARQSGGALELAVSTLIRRYHNACLAVNEPLLKQSVTDPDYLNLEYIDSRYSVTESFSDYDFIIYNGINEFDYVAFVTHKEKIVFSDTPAPCMESYYIEVDEATGIPSIYLGITSLDTDAYCASLIQSDTIQELAKQTNTSMQEALMSDDDLKEFYQLLVSNSSAE